MTRMDEVMKAHTAAGNPTGVAWLVSRRGEVRTGAAGCFSEDSIVRIASMTKPVTAVAALILVEECVLRLEEPVDDLLPELADRRVLADPAGPVDQTVPAARPITVRDCLTFTLGIGMDFDWTQPQPVLQALADAGLPPGPPMPAHAPATDEFMRRLSTVPLARQPGERWLYNTGSDVVGVLVERASGMPFDRFLHERVFEPLGMVDTAFSVPAEKMSRFGPCYWNTEEGERAVWDAADGQWATPPAFALGSAGLVSTVADFHRFAAMLLDGGRPLLSRATVEAMTTNHLLPGQSGPADFLGWGFGVGVQTRRVGPSRGVGSYGWDGGLGTSWANDPAEGLIGIVLTDQLFTQAYPPPRVIQDFWTLASTGA